MRVAYQSDRGVLYRADAIAVAASLPAASVRLVYCDGPYGLGKGEWDRAPGAALVDWYAPHFDSWDRVLMPSASLAVWGLSRSWAHLHVELERRGWQQAGQIVWDKGKIGTTMRADPDVLRSWPQTHEIVGLYQRNALASDIGAAATVQYAAGSSERNWVRLWLVEEWRNAGLTQTQANRACGTAAMAGHYLGAAQWALPTWERYQRMAAYAAAHGRPLPADRHGRPWLVHPVALTAVERLRATFEHLHAAFEHLRADFEHLRADFERLRAPFDLGAIAPSVWSELPPTLGADRHGHACQKPAGLTRRLLGVLSRPGETVFEPFGGSSPVARICEGMHPELARRWVSCETDAGHVARTVEMLRAEDLRRSAPSPRR